MLTAIAGVVVGVVLATRPSEPWWQLPSYARCVPPAAYRIDGGTRQWLGGCTGGFGVPVPSVTMHVGQELDVHMTQVFPRGLANTPQVPDYAIPTSSDSGVLSQNGLSDQASTASFQARSPGLAQLATVAPCYLGGVAPTPPGSCPLLRISVIG